MLKTLGGSSRQSLLSMRAALDSKLKDLSHPAAIEFAADLFTVLTVLSSSVGVRRALTDNSRDASSKSELISNLFGKNIGAQAQALMVSASSLRWSNPAELADAIERIAVEAEASAAEKNNELEKLEDQLFDFTRVLVANPELRQALNTSADSDAGKVALLEAVVKGKYANSTLNLLRRVVVLRRGRSIDSSLTTYSHYVSTRRDRLVAHVKSAIVLSDAQRSKLVAALTTQMGKEVHVNIELDPKVLGGISIRYADDVIDGTIFNRLVQAGRALVS